jgi:hypothetical protein
VNGAPFWELTLSGVIVSWPGIAVSAWLAVRHVKRHVDRQTNRQTQEIDAITSQQTGAIEDMTRAQTRTLLGRSWRLRRSKGHDAGPA